MHIADIAILAIMKKAMKPSHNSKTIQPTEMADPIFFSLPQNIHRGIKTKFVTLQIIDIMVHMIENSSHNLWLTICLNLLSKMLLGQLKTSTDKPYFKILLISSFNVSVVNITLSFRTFISCRIRWNCLSYKDDIFQILSWHPRNSFFAFSRSYNQMWQLSRGLLQRIHLLCEFLYT